MAGQDVQVAIGLVALAVTIAWNVYQGTHTKNKDTVENERRVATLAVENERRISALEIKIGLFWNLVENNMGDLLAKANPINLTGEEQDAAIVYKARKSHTPTQMLKQLDSAIIREMPNLSPDERVAFTMIQAAIRAQLVDRNEYPYRDSAYE